MTDTLFEQLGGTYTQQGDYLLPNLALPAEKETGNIGVWALRHKRYLKQHHKVLYYNLLTSGKLDSYLADIEQQAQQLFLRLVKELAEKEGVTEQLKAADQMAWVRKMNNIRNLAAEIVNVEVVIVRKKYYLHITNTNHRFFVQCLFNYYNKMILNEKYNDSINGQ